MSGGEKYNITEAEVRQALDKKFAGKPYEMVECKIGQASDDALGFLGDHVRIQVRAKMAGEEKTIKFFAKKQITSNQAHRDYAAGIRCFYKEIEHYKSFFLDLEDAISENRRKEARWRPDCYYTRDYELLIVDDLAPQGYYMLPERTLMPLEYIKNTLSTVARMHASNMIFEEKLAAGLCSSRSPHYSKEKGKQTIAELYPNLMFETECSDAAPDHPGFRFWTASFQRQLVVIDALEGYTDEQKTKMKRKFLEIAPQVFRTVERSKKHRNVICHGDLWGNNILFRNGPDGKVKESVLVDFQGTRYSPPALDLFELLHLTQDTAFREQHEHMLKEHYYEALTQELAAEGLDVNQVYPKQDFLDSCEYCKKAAILGQFIYTQVNYAPADLCAKIFATSEGFERFMFGTDTYLLVESLKDPQARERIIEAMEEIVKAFGLAE